MAEISWIKLNVNIFDDEKMKLIDQLPENDAIFRIWVYLLSLAGKTNDSGLVYLSNHIPYTDEMIAALCNRPITTVRLALSTFKSYGMIDVYDNEFIAINNWEKHQNIDGMEKIRKLNAERNKKYRERKKLLENSDVSVTSRDATEEDKSRKDKKRKEEERERENEQKTDVSEQFARYFSIFTTFTTKNQNKRAMALQEFVSLPSFQKDEAIVGAENYVQWYPLDSPDDVSHQYSVNAYEFLRNAMFTEYQEVPNVSKAKPKRTGGMR